MLAQQMNELNGNNVYIYLKILAYPFNFLVMIGGIYLGFFTPTEGAAVGAAGTGLIAIFNKNLIFFHF